MLEMAQEYVPLAIFVFVLLSIHSNRASVQNFLVAATGASILWANLPNYSLWGRVISIALWGITLAMSPLASILFWVFERQKSTWKHANPNSIEVLHDPPHAGVE